MARLDAGSVDGHLVVNRCLGAKNRAGRGDDGAGVRRACHEPTGYDAKR